jgi:hypothetical protein
MYNLVAMIEELAGHLDKDKQDRLFEVKEVASKVISLPPNDEERTSAPSTLDSTDDSERSGNDWGEDELGVFGADDVQAILKKMKYKINFIPFGVRVLDIREYDFDKSNTPCSIRSSHQCRILVAIPRRDT